MSKWLDRILLLALVSVLTALAITALPTLGGEHLGGTMLLGHMLASGALVFGLPLFALVFLRHVAAGRSTSWLQNAGYWLTIATGLITILTVFVCMLPLPATDQMLQLMSIHGWAGFAMVPAVLVLLIGVGLTRSASRPRS